MKKPPYQNVKMISKVPYISVGNRFRPYLEITFVNEAKTNKTLALVDSGADHTVIPYSIGIALGLELPRKDEKLIDVQGVGGSLKYVERKCKIHLPNMLKKEIYVFDETVWWIYPDEATQEHQQKLVKEIVDHIKLQDQAKESTDLHAYFGLKVSETLENLKRLNNTLETGVLIGRPFFNNFEHIQFCHKDREKEDKCFFVYKVDEKKLIEVLEMNERPIDIGAANLVFK
jgi:hypothetical protein